jgi:hypothetical protein
MTTALTIGPAATAWNAPIIPYPTKHVLGVLDAGKSTRGVLVGLRRSGFVNEEIQLIAGDAAANALHIATGHSGLTGWIVRLAQRLGVRDDEMEVKDEYEDALRHGALLVSIDAPNDARRYRAVDVLGRHGARLVNYFGRFVRVEYSTTPR